MEEPVTDDISSGALLGRLGGMIHSGDAGEAVHAP